MRRVGKGFSGVDTSLFDGMLVPQQVHDVVDATKNKDDANEISAKPTPPLPTPATTPPPQQELIPLPSQTCATLTKKVSDLEQDKIAQVIEITKLKQRVERLEKKRKLKASDANEDVTLDEVDAKKDAEVHGRLLESEAQVEEVLEVVTAAKLMIKVVTTATTTITTAPIPKASAPRRRRGLIIQYHKEVSTVSLSVQLEVKPKDKGKGILVEEPKPLKRQAQIEYNEAYARELEAELNANINWNEVIEQVKRKEKQDNAVMRYQALKRKPVTEAQARKNMMHFNSIMAFLEKGEKEIEEKESKQSKRKSESSEQQSANKQRIDEEVGELKTHLQIVPNDEDDVYTKATPLDLKIVQKRFASSEPKNFSDDFLLNALKTMLEKPNVEANIWKNQIGIYGLAKVKSWKLLESCGVHIITFTTTQMILLVERRYPLTRFTLDQMLNNVRLEVKEKSEVSLELLRFVRRQQQEGYKPE
uniref:Uncharacterized protein n=1 Tax=Tanacetum cinerariifolium TaxID=118510 RepID=A0A699IL82_TANCI|nr:hypothetical protein [Tanacetum cinerariifolium]